MLRPHLKAYSTLLDQIGHTDLLKLPKQSPEQATIFAKLEGFNPGGSVKDRIAIAMVQDAEARGVLKPGYTVVEATSGNTGIGLALVCNVKGYALRLFMPDHYSLERRKLLQAYGAELVLTPAEEDMDGARRAAMAYCKDNPRTFMPQQFSNPANPEVHTRSTGKEILADLPQGLQVSALVLGVGTGGSLMGTARALRKQFPTLKVIAIEPALSPVLSGGKRGLHAIHGIGAGFVPEIVERELIDEIIQVKEENAFHMADTLAKTQGLLVGVSSGANIWASTQVAKRVPAETAVVTFICDQGQRYFSFGKETIEELRKRTRLEKSVA